MCVFRHMLLMRAEATPEHVPWCLNKPFPCLKGVQPYTRMVEPSNDETDGECSENVQKHVNDGGRET